MTKDNQKGILRLPQVSELVNLSRSTIYRMIERDFCLRPLLGKRKQPGMGPNPRHSENGPIPPRPPSAPLPPPSITTTVYLTG